MSDIDGTVRRIGADPFEASGERFGGEVIADDCQVFDVGRI